MNRLGASLLLLIALVETAAADNWPNWRGPHYNGVAPEGDYPTTWSSTQNVRWKLELPGKGSSTPIVWEDHIYLTCGIEGTNTVLCVDRQGKVLWQTSLGRERVGKNKKATGSNPSAATDGRHVYVYFKSGDLACLDLAGKIVWQHNLQQMYGADTLWWDLGTSPVLTEDCVVVAVVHSGPSYLAGFEKGTGKLVWKQDRNLNAPSEAAQSYSTPLVLEHEGREMLVVLGADHVTGHDSATGKELWRVGGLNPRAQQFFRSIASPVALDGIVVAPYARGATLTGIRLGGSGDVTKSHVLWTKEGLGADVPTPAAKEGRAYVCTDRGEVACLDIQTGQTLWSGQVERNRNAYSSSPMLAGGNIYITREDGKTFVLKQGNEFKVVAENSLDGEFVVATPVFADGQILLRTLDRLYCIAK
jgi:outer membrane protein assembly factor BamB